MELKDLGDYFRVLPRHFNYLLILQIIPILVYSSILVNEISPALFKKQMLYYSVGFLAFIITALILV